jgi:DNA-binding CsgD family transcriptional regulator
VEAVLEPGGRLLHASGPAVAKTAREALRTAAVAQDRARTRRRTRDGAKATELWWALVAGRWSLVDQFERDGRRFLVARANEPEAAPRAALTHRESQLAGFAALGHSIKMIAYELGLSPSSVSRSLTTVARKLGARSRVELIRAMQAAPQVPDR